MNMNETGRYACRYLGKDFCVSNDTRLTHLNNNDLIVGSSGSSKTGSIVHPQLGSLKDSSLIVADTKGLLHKMFQKSLTERGYKVKCLDFVNPSRSCAYNPLDYIRRNRKNEYNEQDIARIVHALLPDNLNGHDPFWNMSARNVLEFFIAYTLCALPEEDHHMCAVADVYRAYRMPSGENAFRPWLEEHPDSLAAKRHTQLTGMVKADRMYASILTFVDLAIKDFEYRELRHIFNPGGQNARSGAQGKGKKLDLAAMGREKTVLFLNISDCDRSMDKIVNVFYTQVLQTLIQEADKRQDGRLKIPVRIIMDDFASSALIPDFDKIISVVRSRDIWLSLCIQSFTQLESLYSRAQGLTIINNCDHIVYLGSNDMQSAEYIGTRALKTPEKILCMDRSKEYLLEAGKPVRLLDKIPSYSFKEASKEVPELASHVPQPDEPVQIE